MATHEEELLDIFRRILHQSNVRESFGFAPSITLVFGGETYLHPEDKELIQKFVTKEICPSPCSACYVRHVRSDRCHICVSCNHPETRHLNGVCESCLYNAEDGNENEEAHHEYVSPEE